MGKIKMQSLIFAILSITFFGQTTLTSGAPGVLPFWHEEPCTINDELSKSFNESKKYCNSVKVREVKTSEQILCTKLEEDFKELCKSGIKGSASAIPLDEDVCEYDVIKTESLVTACEESCNNKNGNITLCALLIQTHELLTAKFGENGAGKPPVLQSPILLDAAKKVENASKMLEENPKVPVQFQPILEEETPVIVSNAPETIAAVSETKVESKLPPISENETSKETNVKFDDLDVEAALKKEVESMPGTGQEKKDDLFVQKSEENIIQQSVGIDNHMDEEALQEQSQFFSYFVLFTILCIVAYCMYFNKKEILALLLEGRRKNTGGRSSRRSSSAQYRKLDNNLEEAMADNSDDSVRHVIY